jgi:large subunit ribosomal protein L15
MQQHELRQPAGATHKRKRIGRGNASGHGTYSTKGMKGQKARSGGGVRPSFEGGQLPLVRRMAHKRGFRNPFRIEYEEVNVGMLGGFAANTDITAETLRGVRILRTHKPVKVLGEGELAVALMVEASSFSKSAIAKIVAAGGSIRWVDGPPPTPEELAALPEKRAKKNAKAAAKTSAASAASAAKKAASAASAPAETTTETESGEA